MKKILSMIAMVAVFGSSSVVSADTCSDAVAKLKTPFKKSAIINLCNKYDEAFFAVVSGAANGYTFLPVSNSILTEQALTCHTDKESYCAKGKTILVNSSAKNGASACGGGSINIPVEYGMLHELYHAAKGPNSGEKGAINNTNAIRSGEGRTLRADEGTTCPK